jgi:hypothetical protein
MNKKIWGALLVLTIVGVVGATGYTHGTEVAKNPNLIFVSHTEYWSADNFQTIVRLSDFTGRAIDNATCSASVFYPNKTAYLSNQAMAASAIAGNYYYEGLTSATEGTYEELVQCYGTWKGFFFNRTVSESFHVNPALNFLRNISTSIDAINITVDNSLLFQINSTVTDIATNMSNVYTDTQWLSANVMTQTNAAQIEANFTKIQNMLNDYCSTPETNSSQLCVQLYALRDYVSATNTTYMYWFTTINATTTNTYDYVTGTLTTSVNSILGLTQDIKAETAYINQTVTTIKSDIENQISIQIIS